MDRLPASFNPLEISSPASARSRGCALSHAVAAGPARIPDGDRVRSLDVLAVLPHRGEEFHPDFDRSLPAPARPRMQWRNIDRAAYRLGRVLDHRPVDGDLHEVLCRGDQLKQKVARKLWHGRANVNADLRATDRKNLFLHLATWKVMKAEPAASAIPGDANGESLDRVARMSAAAEVAHTGTCSHLTALMMKLHAADLGENDRLVFMTNDVRDHAWAEIASRGKRVAVDSWTSGPAIAVEDGQYSCLPEMAEARFVIDRASAKPFLDACEDIQAVAERQRPKIRAAYDKACVKYGRIRPGDVFESASVFDSDFAQRVSESASREIPLYLKLMQMELPQVRDSDFAGVPPRFGPSEWDWHVRSLAHRCAMDVGATHEEAMDSIEAIVQRVRSLAAPVDEPVAPVDIDNLLGPRRCHP